MRFPIAVTALVAVALTPALANGPTRAEKQGFVGISLVGSPASEVLVAPQSKTTAARVSITCTWGKVEKQDPGTGDSKYDWSSLDSDPVMKSSKAKVVSIDLSNPWADELKDKEPGRYWKLAQRFAAEAAKHCGLDKLVGKDGKVKGDLFSAIMPFIPPIEVVVEVSPGSQIVGFIPGTPYRVSFEAFNPMDEPVENPKFALTVGGEKPIPLQVVDSVTPTVINAVTRIRHTYALTFPDEAAGHEIPAVGRVWYKWKGKDYYADCKIGIPVTSAIEVNVLPRRGLASEVKQVGISIISHLEKDTKVVLSFRTPEGIKITPASAEFELAPSGLDAKVFSISTDPNLAAGTHRIEILVDGKSVDGIELSVPAEGKTTDQ